MDDLTVLTLGAKKSCEDGNADETKKKKKKKKKKELDFNTLKAAGYKPPEDAATELREAREEAERKQQEQEAIKIEEEAIARLEQPSSGKRPAEGEADPSGGEWVAGDGQGRHQSWHFKVHPALCTLQFPDNFLIPHK